MVTPFDIGGRVALVTGARRGIGLAMAEALAAAGADIIAASARMEASGSEIERRVRGLGRSFEGHRVDFGDRAAVLEFAESMSDRPIDILVNNAGTTTRAPAAQYTDADWDRVLAVNLTSQFALTRELGRGMLERGAGKVIFTASVLSFQGGILVPAYAAAKSGLAGLTRALANEWAPRGVNVNAIVPGYIRTDLNRDLQEDAGRDRAIVERIPAGRWGTPEDLAGATVFLASPASAYVHGALIPVDGGWLGR
jgi:2-dehydro-3-deoxy-D-gluconate 5-dehydrogenase